MAKEFGDNRATELIDRLNKEEREILENKIKDNEMFESINTDLRLYQAQQNKPTLIVTDMKHGVIQTGQILLILVPKLFLKI